MAILDQYSRYLEHFGTTVPVRELHADPQTRGLCALRHDVDYDLDVALEMAYWEHEVGARATYYLLPTAAYWGDERLADKCLQLQDYGHEVGLHVNAMAQWASGETDDPERTLMDQLDTLRQAGITVTGMAAHGDRRCYEHNISNYWCFRDLKSQDPAAEEDGRTAEGPYSQREQGRNLRYPKGHVALRPDGRRYHLWSIPMDALGIEYDAWHTQFDQYFSDSGGSWTRTADPADFERGDNRWQVLIHPIHWRGPQRAYFFLAPARSGSKWLSEVLREATPLEARHEYILNQEYHSGDAAQKATATARMLEAEPERVEHLLGQAWEELNQIQADYAEVNVYLPSFLDKLQQYFPAATYVHLKRNPADVVRSLMQRDWYDTPEDHAHPRLHCKNPEAMTSFERVCEYVAGVNHRLLTFCTHRISLESITADPYELEDELRRLGIPYHKRLGDHLFGRVINASHKHEFPPPSRWTADQKRQFGERIERIDARMGYGQFNPRQIFAWTTLADGVRSLFRRIATAWGGGSTETIEELPEITVDPERVYGENCAIRFTSTAMFIERHDPHRHAYVTVGGSRWHEIPVSDKAPAGWPVEGLAYVKGHIVTPSNPNGAMTVWALTYGADGRQIHKRRLGALDKSRDMLDFAFAPHPSGERFDIAIHLSQAESIDTMAIESPELEYKSYRNPSGTDDKTATA